MQQPFGQVSILTVPRTPGVSGISTATVIKDTAGVLSAIKVTTAGFFSINNSATVAGANSSNLIFSGNVLEGQIIQLNRTCGAGITVSAITTAVISVSYA
ncbi:MAG: hypothetical protein ACRESI_06495 [Gammaproteobacteria bacterium]